MPSGDTTVQERARRRRVRPSVGGMSSSSCSTSGALSSSADLEGEDVIDVNERMQAEVERFAPPVPSAADAPDAMGLDSIQEDRIRANGYGKEQRMALVHQMMMRNVPVAKMAAVLKVSESTIVRDRKELEKRLRAAAQDLNIDQHIGDSLAFYAEAQGMALRSASHAKTPIHVRLGALRTAVSTRNDMHKFLQAVGVYDVLKYTAAAGGQNDIHKLMDLTTQLLEGEENEALDVLAAASSDAEDDAELALGAM